MAQAGLKNNSAPAEEELTMNLGYESVHLRFVGPMIRHDPSHLRICQRARRSQVRRCSRARRRLHVLSLG